jgi:hypothetical protein
VNNQNDTFQEHNQVLQVLLEVLNLQVLKDELESLDLQVLVYLLELQDLLDLKELEQQV